MIAGTHLREQAVALLSARLDQMNVNNPIYTAERVKVAERIEMVKNLTPENAQAYQCMVHKRHITSSLRR